MLETCFVSLNSSAGAVTVVASRVADYACRWRVSARNDDHGRCTCSTGSTSNALRFQNGESPLVFTVSAISRSFCPAGVGEIRHPREQFRRAKAEGKGVRVSRGKGNGIDSKSSNGSYGVAIETRSVR